MNKNEQNKKDSSGQTHLVSGFQGYYSFLSNDFPAWTYFDGILYPSVNIAFQAARTNQQSLRQKISQVNDVEQFIQLAMSITNPSDWGERKQKIMTNLVRDKFKRNKQLLDKLLATKDKKLINVMKKSGFNQQFWGVYNGNGKNVLGKILMLIRQQFIKGLDTKNWLQNNLSFESDPNMFPKVVLLVLKDGKKIQKLQLNKNKNHYLLGSLKTSDFHLQNPTISRNHACIYFNDLQVMIVDLKSTHGSFIKKKGTSQKIQIQGLIPYLLQKQDIITFGTSARQYVVDIDRSQIQKFIADQEHELNAVDKTKKHQVAGGSSYQNLSKQQVKNMLGIEKKCILVSQLKQADNYQKIKDYFNSFAKVKNVRMKINSTTGKTEGKSVVYFQNKQLIQKVLSKRNEITYKIQVITQSQAELLLRQNTGQKQRNNIQRNRSRSRSKQQSKSRSRSRQKRSKKQKNK